MVCAVQVQIEMRNGQGKEVDFFIASCWTSYPNRGLGHYCHYAILSEDKHVASRRQCTTKKLLLPAIMMDFVVDEVEAV